MQFDGLPEGAVTTGMAPGLIYTATEVYASHVVLDGNHPLAGMALQLAVKVCAVRVANDDELAARSVSESALSVVNPLPASPQVH